MNWLLSLFDDRPYALQASLTSPPAVGEADVLTVTLLQANGSVDHSGPSTVGRPCTFEDAALGQGMPQVHIMGPTGALVATPLEAVCPSIPEENASAVYSLVFQSAFHYRFVPPAAGTYRVAVEWPGYVLSNRPWALQPANLLFTVASTH